MSRRGKRVLVARRDTKSQFKVKEIKYILLKIVCCSNT